MLDLSSKFTNVLQEGEEVLFATKAHTASYVMKRILLNVPAIVLLIVTSLITIPLAIFMHPAMLIWGYFPYVIIMSIVALIARLGCRNYCVCITKSRVIIRKGIITTNYSNFAIEKVSGNIRIEIKESFFDKSNDKSCYVNASIELLPVGHGRVHIMSEAIKDGYKFAKLIEKQVKENSKKINIRYIKE